LLDSTGVLNSTGLTQWALVDRLDLSQRAQVDGLDGRARLNRTIGLPHRLLGMIKPRGALPSSSPLLPNTMAVAAAQDCSSTSFARWSLGAHSPSLPLADDNMVWRVPRKLVATQLGQDGCILHRTTRMSQVKTCPEVRPTRTDSHAAQKGGLTFRCIALSLDQSCLGGGGGKPQSLKPAPPSTRGGVVGVVGRAVATATMEDFAFPCTLLPPSTAPSRWRQKKRRGATTAFKGWGEDGGSVGEEDGAMRASCHCVCFGKM
jgi:hypothetical protein